MFHMMISHELAILVWVRRLEVHSGIVHAVQMVEPLCSFAPSGGREILLDVSRHVEPRPLAFAVARKFEESARWERLA